MKNVVLNLPTFGFIVSTRAALGVGIGLLLSERLLIQRRRALGATLIALGAVTTVPAALSVIRGLRRSNGRKMSSPIFRDKQLIGATRFPRKGDDDGV
jgi:O-antigen ligase